MPSRDSRNSPTVISAVPTTGKILYRPHLVTRKPVPMEVSSSPTISGSSLSPDRSGDPPDDLHVLRQVGQHAEHGEADGETDHAGGGEHPVREQVQRYYGLGRPPLHHDETSRADDREHPQQDDREGTPARRCCRRAR